MRPLDDPRADELFVDALTAHLEELRALGALEHARAHAPQSTDSLVQQHEGARAATRRARQALFDYLRNPNHGAA